MWLLCFPIILLTFTTPLLTAELGSTTGFVSTKLSFQHSTVTPTTSASVIQIVSTSATVLTPSATPPGGAATVTTSAFSSASSLIAISPSITGAFPSASSSIPITDVPPISPSTTVTTSASSQSPSIHPSPTTSESASLQPSTPVTSPASTTISTATPLSETSTAASVSPMVTVGSVIPTEQSVTAPLPTSGPPSEESTVNTETGSRIPVAAIVGIVIGGVVAIVAIALSVFLVSCFCCCWMGSKKFEYSTGNENRMTVHQWHITSAHYNMNRADSVSSVASSKSRGSSLFGSFGFPRRYSNSADHVSSIVNQSIPDLYSTPL